ncbi:MAG: TIGR00159 family protein [Nitrospirae bacterium]|nr:TIGR00159 family protein [Nitrospirota bacterium]
MPEFIRLFRITDILDILLVSIVFYRLLLLIKGTRAARMLLGLGLLLAALLLSRKLSLYTLDWLIQSFWTQIVLAVIILFQPEIRRALAQVGGTKFFSPVTRLEGFKSLEELVKASVALSHRQIGALMVIEREVNLSDLIEVGTPMDAKVSPELLLSIFHTTSPIHDGAVIVRGNRIIAAGCFLPLPISANLSKSLGTRHRAAVGLTEETDAICIVVSEESGEISVAMDGGLQKGLAMDDLRELLNTIFVAKK